jgi:CIC family chloride channel protein
LIGRLCFGDVPPFLIPGLELPTGQVVHLAGLPLFVILGLALGGLAALFVRSIYWFEDGFDRIPGNYYTRHMLGMLLVGVMMFAFMTRSESLFSQQNHYYIEGVGYATIVDVLAGDLGAPVFLLLLAAAKLLATSLTLGSGASGGVFSPCLFIGATAGGAFGALVGMMFPGLGISPAAFAVVGMASMVAGSTGALVTGIVMLFEMTRDYHVILPLALTAVIATAVRKRLSPASVYTLKLLRRGHVVPEGLEAAIDAARTAGHLATSDFGIWRIDPEQSAESTPQAVPGAAVTIVARGREILGILSGDGARPGAANESYSATISTDFIIVDRDEGMLDLLARLDESRAHYAVVVAHAGEPWADGIIGVVRDRDVVRVAREAALLTR